MLQPCPKCRPKAGPGAAGQHGGDLLGVGRPDDGGGFSKPLLDDAEAVLKRAGERLRLSSNHTVVALAGGTGSGTGLASEGAVQIADGGRFLLAVDAGSDQVSALRIEPDGSLRLASVVSSNGALPVSIAVHGSLVYVANAGAGASNYAGFSFDRFGRLHPIPGATFALPDAAQPGDTHTDHAANLVLLRVYSSRYRPS